MDANDIGLLEAIHSQRQVVRYKPDPVPMEIIEQIVEAATRAPNGANLQCWEFIVITDRDLVRRVGELYRELWLDRIGRTSPPDETRAFRSARHLAHHMPEVPAMIFVCVDHARGPQPYKVGDPIVRNKLGSSVWPAVQNLFLAARAFGLGTRLTAVHIHRDADFKALLDIPDHVETVCLTPLGYPDEPFGPTRRRPPIEVTSFDRYDNRRSSFTSPA